MIAQQGNKASLANDKGSFADAKVTSNITISGLALQRKRPDHGGSFDPVVGRHPMGEAVARVWFGVNSGGARQREPESGSGRASDS